jgi:hypothetical protein
MRNYETNAPSQFSSPYAALYAFLKDGHYNHSPQIHPIGMFGATVFSVHRDKITANEARNAT